MYAYKQVSIFLCIHVYVSDAHQCKITQDFSVSSHTSDSKVGTLVAALPGALCCRVSAGTGWPGVSIL